MDHTPSPAPDQPATRELTAEQTIRAAAVGVSAQVIAAAVAAGNDIGSYHRAVLLGAQNYAAYITDGEML